MGRILVLAALLASLAAPAASDPPPQFTDAACPDATPLSRHLNELTAASTNLTPDLMSTALKLVAIYQTCADGYDRGTVLGGASQDTSASGVSLLRLYSHLALARAQQRVGNYYVAQHKYADARASYDAALKLVTTLKEVYGSSDVPSGSAQRSLLDKGVEIRKEIETAEAALPKAGLPAGSTPDMELPHTPDPGTPARNT
jgi:hypothetical protein